MPIRLRDTNKFTWLEADGLPLAPVVRIGMTTYILCCPGCGCCHELTGQRFEETGEQIVTKPRCLLREFATGGGLGSSAWRVSFEAWVKTHPGAADVSEVRAVYLGSVSTVHSVAIAMKKLAKYAGAIEQEVKAAA